MARWNVLGITIAAVVAASVVVACSSLPDLHFADADVDGGVGGEGGTEGGNPLCKGGGPEICNDGVDNDCNLLADCKDAFCVNQGFTCETIPSGWTAVTFSATARPSCGPGETPIDLKVAAGDSTGTCDCSCKAAGGDCGSGNYTVASADDSSCASGPTTTSVPVDNGACTALNASIALAVRAMATPPQGPTSCMLVAAVSAALTDGRLCQPPAVGTGCAAGEACAPKPSDSLASCITTSGKAACPSAFPKRSTAGTSATDTRACSGCACAAPLPCTGGSVSLYDNAMCKTVGNSRHADDIGATCDDLAPSSSFTATHFKSTPPMGGCAAPTAQGTVTGGLSFVGERTVCCK